ncbi:cytochrome c peroxidase [Sorangium sp. So ce448]|uniref:cytochrome-c peroxidase n=1 Tax=Sorangium sp. So ce448 TaxID=3133314 RepID=UPI003F5ED1A7
MTPSSNRGGAIGLAALLLAGGCGDDGLAAPGAPGPLPPLVTDVIPAGFPARTAAARAPADNALTEARAQLGKRLFFDKRLSRTGEVACASCHRQEYAFADPDPVSRGVDGRLGQRNAPALVNLAWGESFFWDGRAATLEEQVGKPIENPDEMDLPLAEAVARVSGDDDYVTAFKDAYGGPPGEESLRHALASFVRSIVSADSRYDRHKRGDDTTFGDAERRGEALFLSEPAGCFHCHPSGMLTNEGFFNNGTYLDGGDVGRQVITGRTGDLGKFKVPALRNIAASAPYMHDGSLATLEEVVDQYDRGGLGHSSTDPQIEELGLSPDEKADLVAFLRSLTDAAFLDDPRYRP